MRALVLSLLLLPQLAHAETADDHVSRARELHDKGDFVHARDELLAAYQIDPRPELLFALGQIEFNIGHYAAAIDYYQRFAQTNPSPEQAALVEQAIGAARIKLAQPPPAPPRPPPHREWDPDDTGLVALGGLAAAIGAGLVLDATHVANDRSGTLRAYDEHVQQASNVRLAGIACAGAGAIAIAAAALRWRFHLVETTVEVHASPAGAAISLELRR